LSQKRSGGGVAGPGVSENSVEGGHAVPNLVGRWGVKVEPAPATEGRDGTTAFEGDHGSIEGVGVVNNGGGDGLAEVLGYVAGDRGVVADEANIDDG